MVNDIRFTGFSTIYDSGRPCLPDTLFEYINRHYLPEIEVIADIGCGTGLSTVTCSRHAEQVYAVDLSEDMLKIATEKGTPRTEFQLGRGEATGLPSDSADIALFCQNFHWMDIEKTLIECRRILRKRGIILIVDYSHMPEIDQEIETIAYSFQRDVCTREKAEKPFRLKTKKYDELLAEYAAEYEVDEYRFKASEYYNAGRFFNFILSKSSIQNAFNETDIDKDALCSKLYSDLDKAFQGTEKMATFQYRVYICYRKEGA